MIIFKACALPASSLRRKAPGSSSNQCCKEDSATARTAGGGPWEVAAAAGKGLVALEVSQFLAALATAGHSSCARVKTTSVRKPLHSDRAREQDDSKVAQAAKRKKKLFVCEAKENRGANYRNKNIERIFQKI